MSYETLWYLVALHRLRLTPLYNTTIERLKQLLSSIGGQLTRWGQVTPICVSILTIIGSDNGLSPGWRQAIIWTNARMLIGHLGTNFGGMLIEIHTSSSKKMHLKMSSGKWRPFCLALSVLIIQLHRSSTFRVNTVGQVYGKFNSTRGWS